MALLTDKESHKRLRTWVRDLVNRELLPYINDWEKAGKAPATLYKKFGDMGFLNCLTGIKPWPTKWTTAPPPCGIAPEEWDPFHEVSASCAKLIWIYAKEANALDLFIVN
jgi:hypothetical protein